MLSTILTSILEYCEALGDAPVEVRIQLASGKEIAHPFPRPRAEMPSKARQRRAGPGYRSALWDGVEYAFSATQARAVQVLWEAWESGMPELHHLEVVRLADSDQPSLRNLFARHPAWGVMIVHGSGKGMVRLAPPEHEHGGD